MIVAEHWHAYTFVANSRPSDSDCRNPASRAPALEVAEFLNKDTSFVVENFQNDDAGRTHAYAWLAAFGKEHRRLQEDFLPLETYLQYSEDCLNRGADVVWGYYTTAQRYVAADLIACPRPGYRCPHPLG